MNKEIKTEWVAKLRDPNTRQARGQLKTTDGFCCLGILCELAVGYGIISPASSGYEYDECSFLLPNKVMEWAGLPASSGSNVEINNKFQSLAGHNDNGRSFQQIADAIEEQL